MIGLYSTIKLKDEVIVVVNAIGKYFILLRKAYTSHRVP